MSIKVGAPPLQATTLRTTGLAAWLLARGEDLADIRIQRPPLECKEQVQGGEDLEAETSG